MAKKEIPTKTTDVAAVENAFEKLADFNLGEAMAEELSGLDAGLERIKIPSAGSTVFEMPDMNSMEAETVKEFAAVILFHHTLHAYYESKYTGGNNPPDCFSFDGMNGEGHPGGNCEKCTFNQFGSGENGAKACKNRRRIYVLKEGELFPLLLSLPTGSLKEFTKYIKRLLSKGRKSNMVVTRFSLKKATNSGGIAYSQAQFTLERPLTAEEQTLIDRLSAQVKTYSRMVSVDDDYGVEMSDDSESIDINPETNLCGGNGEVK